MVSLHSSAIIDIVLDVVRAYIQLVDSANAGQTNPQLQDKIRIVRGMVEDPEVQADVLKSGKVDTIISEPIGVMLLHERMVRLSCCPISVSEIVPELIR